MKLTIKIYSFDAKSIVLLTQKIQNKLKLLNLANSSLASLPTKKHKFTVLRSPHVNKKSREQFGMSIHKRIFTFKNLSNTQQQGIKILLIYLKSLCAEGQIKVTYMPGKI